MKKTILMISMVSTGLCFGVDFIPVRQVAPQEPVLLAMVIGAAAGNNLVNNAGTTTITCARPKNQSVPKRQKNNHRKQQRINQPRKGY